MAGRGARPRLAAPRGPPGTPRGCPPPSAAFTAYLTKPCVVPVASPGPGPRPRGPDPATAATRGPGGGGLLDREAPEGLEGGIYFRSLNAAGSVAQEGEAAGERSPANFFELFGVGPHCSDADVKRAYRRLQKLCHPDIAGPRAAPMAMLLNTAALMMGDPQFRRQYRGVTTKLRDAGLAGFDGRARSRWAGKPGMKTAVFVDETACIGCTQCAAAAPRTFEMDPAGENRARVHTQWGDGAVEVHQAVEVCPVDCIFYVERAQLALLEFVMRGCLARRDGLIAQQRLNGGYAPGSRSPFQAAELYAKNREKYGEGEAARRALGDGGDGGGGGGSQAAAPEERRELEEHSEAIAKAYFALDVQTRLKGWGPVMGNSVEF